MTSREDHLKWCKGRALQYLTEGDTFNAFTSMVSDLQKHPETKNHIAVELGISLMAIGVLDDVKSMRDFIEGFN